MDNSRKKKKKKSKRRETPSRHYVRGFRDFFLFLFMFWEVIICKVKKTCQSKNVNPNYCMKAFTRGISTLITKFKD